MTGPRTVPPSSADTRPAPSERIRRANDAPVRSERAYVLYWMVAARRARANFALQRAAELAVELARPLIVFEPLRVGYPWASDRLHAFVLQGMVVPSPDDPATAHVLSSDGTTHYTVNGVCDCRAGQHDKPTVRRHSRSFKSSPI